MTITVQYLIARLEQFQDGATVQVEDDGIDFHISEIKEKGGNAVLVIKSDDDEDDESEDDE
ncbi:hypothetical protein [Trichormus variabilis]|uniref:Uncharacterized protein n=1 Tax=Trichormus variabilis SAG 1403-4b TaxID=447716 RepID=A0A433UIT8_ANAVA|nr:hypothetical protein [Trichormus variabilis]MBD2628834.1 hypothetical protein [Trichormus variabilis FACHB-164]RUS93760.1 hypothetical protein DSM107003_42610 [Trichormus variabilis SAG 1403-4b]